MSQPQIICSLRNALTCPNLAETKRNAATGFGVACVADILEKVEAELPKVAQEAGVDIIVSKWDVMFKSPSIEIVDVTSHLVKLFNPDEKGLKVIESLQEQPPVPLRELLLELSKEK